MSDLTALRARVLNLLSDVTPSTFTTGQVDESLHRALDEYSQFNPMQGESLFELPGDGWEIALNGISGLLRVLAVHWPYDSTLDEDQQHDNLVAHWFLWWDDAQPIVTIVTTDGSMPEEDDEIRVWYDKAHTIDGFSGGTVTTLPDLHESLVVTGAAAFTAMSQSIAMMNDEAADLYSATLMATWGRAKEREFRQLLSSLAVQIGQTGQQRKAWSIDKWDRIY